MFRLSANLNSGFILLVKKIGDRPRFRWPSKGVSYLNRGLSPIPEFDGVDLEPVLNGRPFTVKRKLASTGVETIIAAEPIQVGGEVHGAVLV